MHAVDQVPVGVFHLVKGLVAQDARVVDHHIDAPVGVQRLLNDVRAVGHRVMIGNRLATGLANLLHHPVGCGTVRALALGAATQVVDHHSGAMAGEQQGMGTPQSAAGPGHDHDLVFEADGISHMRTPSAILVG